MKYDYKCSECEHIYEINCKISEFKQTTQCPACKGVGARHHALPPLTSRYFKGSFMDQWPDHNIQKRTH